MLFPHPFWPVDADMFGRVAETTVDRGEFFLFYSYAHVCGCGTAISSTPAPAPPFSAFATCRQEGRCWTV